MHYTAGVDLGLIGYSCGRNYGVGSLGRDLLIPGHFYVYRVWNREATVFCGVWEIMAGNPRG